jgi:mRNA-degrading endonuclease RelE of RelBE toxin-antitoxin system
LTENISGISDSNGQFAEEYFYNSLEKKMEFAGVHFDSISNEFRRLRKTPNGRIKDQFDIVLFNGNTIALIEIKYKARKKNLDKMLKQKISNFRLLFPEYAKHKIYLGIGGMSFDKNVVDEAKKLGIGLLKQVGETIEYETKWVRAY